MIREQFIKKQLVFQFTTWAANALENIICDLHIRKSRYVSGGIKGRCIGVNAVLKNYRWRTSWGVEGKRVASEDWESTKISLSCLSKCLMGAVNNDNEIEALDACRNILKWGGDRNANKGATPQIVDLRNSGTLNSYLRETRGVLQLGKCDLNKLGSIKFAGSMWTKIYALNASDGLPIYDSRVGAAIGALVEIFRIQTDQAWNDVPDDLRFRIERYENRNIARLNPNGMFPGFINRNSSIFSIDWSSATVRLAWIMEEILNKNPKLFPEEKAHADRMHALEASLFMMGYDNACLIPNTHRS